MITNEYLERIVAEQYKREVDQEENVIRSLPFAATGLAVIFTSTIFVRNSVPCLKFSVYSIIMWTLLTIFCLDTALALYFLSSEIARKRLDYLPPSDKLYSYVTQLRKYYEQLGTPPSEIERRVIEDTRTLMIEQYSLGAIHMRNINVQRLRARTRAFQSLIVALGLVLAIIVTILVRNIITGGGSGPVASQGAG
jgi:hypothetical protein